MAGNAFGRRSNRVVMQCCHDGCHTFVSQEVPLGRVPRAPVCLDCQARVGNWLWREVRRLDALEAGEEPQCELCGQGQQIGIVRPCAGAAWVNVCETCYRIVKALQEQSE